MSPFWCSRCSNVHRAGRGTRCTAGEKLQCTVVETVSRQSTWPRSPIVRTVSELRSRVVAEPWSTRSIPHGERCLITLVLVVCLLLGVSCFRSELKGVGGGGQYPSLEYDTVHDVIKVRHVYCTRHTSVTLLFIERWIPAATY